MAKTKSSKDDQTIIKKYANRRLYDTGRSSYVTLDDLCEMVQEGYNFVVIDAKSGDDITRSVLTQIVADQESGDETLLPTDFLRNLIGFYGDNMQAMVPSYLQQSMEIFKQNQESMRDHVSKSLGGIGNIDDIFPQSNMLEEMARTNMELFERTMKMMQPFNMVYGSQEKNTKSESEE